MAITFSNPQYLWLLILLPLFIVTHFYSLKFVKKRALRFANFEAIRRVSGRKRVDFNWFIIILRFIVIVSIILSLSGMIFWYEGASSNNNFVLALDASGSMLASDFEPNRLDAAKKAAETFVDTLDSRALIGVVSFSGLAEVESQMTTNFLEVKESIAQISFKSIHGTAIGDAIKVSLNLFPENGKPNTLVLLTDGRENVVSKSDLERVLLVASDNKITIYTIGIGTSQGGIVPGLDITSTIDDDTLSQIAESTAGKYFRVNDITELESAYRSIATASDSEIPIPLSVPLIIFSLVMLLIEWGLINTKFKTIP